MTYSQYKHENDIDVVFRKFEDGEVLALFPNEHQGRGFIMSYQHVGQHGDARPALIDELEEAEYHEYDDLLAELIGRGYKNLHVLTEQTIEARRQPTASEIRFGYGATHYAEFNLNDFIDQKTGRLKKWIKSHTDNLRYYR